MGHLRTREWHFQMRQWVILLPLALLIALISCGKDQTPATEPKTSATDPVPIDGTLPADVGTDRSTSDPARNKEPASSDAVEPGSADSDRIPESSLLSDADFQRRAKLGHLVAKRRCVLCHKVDGRGGILQPPLIQVSVRRLERMKTISEHLAQLQTDDPDRYQARADLFNSIEAEPDELRKMSIWLHGYLEQPTFDNAQAKMPLPVLKPEEIDQLASYVIQLAVDGVKQGVSTPE
ncbi:MAG: hypothetical protein OSB09_11570 [Planctomycetota bacterium]|nr:hypothetical protein [Planctomycetota bacterium]